MQNPQATVISRFANSPVLNQLIVNFNDYIDPTANINAFYDLVWNVATAVGYGLDVWGRIVGVSRTLYVPSVEFFGFNQPGEWVGWSQAPFYSGQSITSNYSLGDAAFLTLIYAKAFKNITNCSIPAINLILMTLFGSQGECYCTDGQNMTMTYTFSFVPSVVDLAIIAQSGVLPRPCGVSVSVIT
jgi:hypothetical protein